MHPPRAPSPQHIQLISNLGDAVAPSWDLWGNLFRVEPSTPPWGRQLGIVVWRLCVVDYEFGAKEIRPEMGYK